MVVFIAIWIWFWIWKFCLFTWYGGCYRNLNLIPLLNHILNLKVLHIHSSWWLTSQSESKSKSKSKSDSESDSKSDSDSESKSESESVFESDYVCRNYRWGHKISSSLTRWWRKRQCLSLKGVANLIAQDACVRDEDMLQVQQLANKLLAMQATCVMNRKQEVIDKFFQVVGI